MLRLTHYPALGKVPALRALLEGQVRARQAAGYRSALSMTFLGSDGPEFKGSFLFEDLAAYEKFRADPSPPAFNTQVQSLISRAGHLELSKPVVQAATGGGPYAYVFRSEYKPTTGKFGELRDGLAETIRERQAAGVRTALFTAVVGPPTVIVYRFLQTLSELDTSPPPTPAQQARLTGLFSAPPVSYVGEMIIPWGGG